MRRNSAPVLLLLSFVVACGSDSGDPDPNPPRNHDEALQRLGVNTSLSALIGLDGKALPTDYNPLNRKHRPLQPLYEIYTAGPAAPTGLREMLREDGSAGYAMVDIGTKDDSWASYPKVATHGDLDDDGREEVALLIVNNDPASPDYRKLFLRVVEDKAEAWAVEQKTIATLTDTDLTRLMADDTSPYLKLDLGAGDVDGDGKDELFAACLSRLWVLDDRDAKESFGVILEKEFPPGSAVDQFVRVAGGDTDGDAKAELVVAVSLLSSASSGSVEYHIYDDLAEKTSGVVKVEGSEKSELMTADVAIGDVDGDKRGEIVFSGLQHGTPNLHKVLVMDDARESYAFLPVLYKYTHDSPGPIHRVETGDLDGDGAAEIVSFTEILDDLRSNTGLERRANLPEGPRYGTCLAIGDVNKDLREEIIYLHGTASRSLGIFGTGSGSTYGPIHSIDLAENPPYPTLTTVNTDDDSPIVEFRGHELRFTTPRILAILAAPPHYQDIPTDNAQAGTSFGKGAGNTVEKALSLGFMVGWSSQVEARYIAVSGSVKTSVEASFDLRTSEASTIEKAYYYNGTAASDKVVFAAVPFDVYYYKVLSSPRPEEVGMKMVVNIPREPQILFVDRQFFNDNNGSFPDIDSTVLHHTIGDPRSYPRESSVDKAGLQKNGGFYSAPMTVGQGPGSQTVSINSTSSQSLGLDFKLETKVEIQGGVDFDIGVVSGTAKTGPEFGFHFGFNYTISSSRTTYYSGTVGNILSGADFATRAFKFGLFVQPTPFQGQRFPLVHYYVD